MTNVDLASYNTFRVSAKAANFLVLGSLTSLKSLMSLPAPFLVLGNGANVLFTNDFLGTVVKNELRGRNVIREDDQSVTIELASGEDWHDFVMWSVENGLSGVENLALIPGTVGAAAVGNIAAYGQNVSEVIESVQGYSLSDLSNLRTLSNQDCHFTYRDSVFKNELAEEFFVTAVTFRLSKTPKYDTNYHSRYESLLSYLPNHPNTPHTPKEIAQAVIAIRRVKMPDWTKIGTAGSFFKNPLVPWEKYRQISTEVTGLQWYPAEQLVYSSGPSSPSTPSSPPDLVKIPAGRLLDELGWKGKQIGRVGTFAKHALVVINLGGATGQEILEFTQRMQADIKSHYDIDLEPEVNII